MTARILTVALALLAAAPASAQQLAALRAEDAAASEAGAGEQRIAGARIRTFIAEYAMARSPAGPASTEVEIAWDRDVVLPAGEPSLRVQPQDPNATLAGYVRMNVEFLLDGKTVWTESVPTRIKTFKNVLVVTAPIRRGALIPAEAVAVRRLESGAVQAATFGSPEEAVGRRAKQMLDVGAVLYANAVDLPPVVRRGAMVNLVIETPTLTISTLGEVKEQGGAGDTVRVQNVASGKVVFGRVQDAQTVKVRF